MAFLTFDPASLFKENRMITLQGIYMLSRQSSTRAK